jgi:hypothetical protein
VPKRKPSRSRRKASRRRPPPRVADAPTRPTAAPVAVTTPGTAPAVSEPPRERPTSRAPTRDYTYVRREIQRIVLLAATILIAIVVLSFFLP